MVLLELLALLQLPVWVGVLFSFAPQGWLVVFTSKLLQLLLGEAQTELGIKLLRYLHVFCFHL